MIIGFTGTRKGMTDVQKEAVRIILNAARISMAYHGGCIGADEEFHAICEEMDIPTWVLWGHPKGKPECTKYQADIVGAFESGPEPFLDRNRTIVDAVELLIACPESMGNMTGGTWFTVRYANEQHCPTLVIEPNKP